MARYKEYCDAQTKLLPVSFDRQILPGTFEYTLNHLIDHEFDLSAFEARYSNDETGAPAYDPAIVLKIMLYAYSRGVVSSRETSMTIRTTPSVCTRLASGWIGTGPMSCSTATGR